MSAPKTAAQQAKKLANIKAYQARCERLRQTSQMTKAERTAKAEAELNAKLAAEKLQREQEEADAAKAAYEAAYVQQALNGPHKAILLKWLAQRIPTFQRVFGFFSKSPNLTAPVVNLNEQIAA